MKSVAIITPKIDTFSNPTLIALIDELIERKIKILFFGFEQIFIPKHVREKLELNELPFNFYKFEPSFRRMKKITTQYVDLFVKLKIKNKVEYLICVDPMGLVIAGRMKSAINAKIIYASFEIFFDDEFFVQRKKILKELEMKYSSDVDTVIIQDPRREKLLRDVNNFDEKTKFVHIPVSPMPSESPETTTDVHKEFGIPRDKKIAVYSGSLQGWSGISEILDLFPEKWNYDYWFLIHSHHRLEADNPVKKTLDRLIGSGMPITIHDKPFYEYKDYASFLAGCDVGFATYFPNPLDIFAGKNIQVIGLSSGKFSTYMMLGLPAVTTNHKTYAELNRDYSFGSIIDTPEDIPNALRVIGEDIESMKQNCKRLYREVLDPTKNIRSIVDYIERGTRA
ncbi:MAG: hypothetical protein IPL67_17105 [Ignavibacteria bacterium]|nr:hypothetical protein [Ignavibacteria bacterium]